jgi:hypothetical protein
MKAIDRVMRAYSSTRALTEEQAAIAHREFSFFIHELMFKPSATQGDDKVENLKSDLAAVTQSPCFKSGSPMKSGDSKRRRTDTCRTRSKAGDGAEEVKSHLYYVSNPPGQERKSFNPLVSSRGLPTRKRP